MKLIVIIPSIFIIAICLTGCYTHVELPKHIPTKKLNIESERLVNFTYMVIDTFDNDWFPDEGYYYTYSPRSGKRIKEDRIDLFLSMLYTKGYNVEAAWHRSASNDCDRYKMLRTPGSEPSSTGSPVIIILLSDVDDSIIQYDFYPLLSKPYITCPYNVEEYWIE